MTSKFEKFDILKGRLQNYANVNAFDLAALKANLTQPGNEAFLDIFRSELDETIAGNGVPRSTYEALTDDEFDDDDAYVDYLKGIRGYLFEDAPHP